MLVVVPEVVIRTRPSPPTATPSGAAERLTWLVVDQAREVDDVERRSRHSSSRRAKPHRPRAPRRAAARSRNRRQQLLLGRVVDFDAVLRAVDQIQSAARFIENQIGRAADRWSRRFRTSPPRPSRRNKKENCQGPFHGYCPSGSHRNHYGLALLPKRQRAHLRGVHARAEIRRNLRQDLPRRSLQQRNRHIAERDAGAAQYGRRRQLRRFRRRRQVSALNRNERARLQTWPFRSIRSPRRKLRMRSAAAATLRRERNHAQPGERERIGRAVGIHRQHAAAARWCASYRIR